MLQKKLLGLCFGFLLLEPGDNLAFRGKKLMETPWNLWKLEKNNGKSLTCNMSTRSRSFNKCCWISFKHIHMAAEVFFSTSSHLSPPGRFFPARLLRNPAVFKTSIVGITLIKSPLIKQPRGGVLIEYIYTIYKLWENPRINKSQFVVYSWILNDVPLLGMIYNSPQMNGSWGLWHSMCHFWPPLNIYDIYIYMTLIMFQNKPRINTNITNYIYNIIYIVKQKYSNCTIYLT